MNYLKELKQIRPLNLIMLLIAGIINAIVVVMFLYPVKLYDSGISGTSMFILNCT